MTIWLLTSLDGAALTLGAIWLVCGVVYLGYLTRLFRRPPPEMEFSEDVDVTAETTPAAGHDERGTT